MRITVFGASGRTGRLVVERALGRGLEVTAFARPKEGTDTGMAPGVRVAVGSVHDPAAVGDAVAGSDAVISALGPIAEVTTTEISQATATIVAAMQQAGVTRLVLPANDSVFTDEEVTSPYANVAAEHRRDLALARASDLDWTVLAPALLRDGPVAGRFEAVVDGPATGDSIARDDFALAMVDALDRTDWHGHVIGLAS